MAKHFDSNGKEIRCVYLAEFDADNFCYVGTTNDYDERIAEHLFKDRRSEVFQHKRHTGFTPQFTMLHDYTSIEEADQLEYFYTIEYAKKGRKILNVQKPGGYGHKDSSCTSAKKIKGRIVEDTTPYNAEKEYKKRSYTISNYKHKEEYSESVKKVYCLLFQLCSRVIEEGGERIYIRVNDIPYAFDYEELNSYNVHSPIKSTRTPQLCTISYVYYIGNKENLSYIECFDIYDKIQELNVSCLYSELNELENTYDEIYQKCHVFKRTKELQGYYRNNLECIDKEITSQLFHHDITAPFKTKIEIEKLGYKESMACSKIDYAIMLTHIGGCFYPSFEVDFDENWNLSCISLNVSYNSYSVWAKRYDMFEIQNGEIHAKFRKLVEKIDNYIYAEKDEINEYPARIEISAKNLGISDIDMLKLFMIHFYIGHGIALDTGSPDSCICSIEKYYDNKNGSKLFIDIQGEQFFLYYDLKNHKLDDSNSYLNAVQKRNC